MSVAGPTKEQAMQFVVMLSAGLPADQAIAYFSEDGDPNVLAKMLAVWTRSRAVAEAQKLQMGKSWQDMSLEERVDAALNQHYSSLAYLLFSTNYLAAGPAEKGKLDSARVALEAKKAGTSGQMSAMDLFFADVKSGRVKLNPPSPTKAAH